TNRPHEGPTCTSHHAITAAAADTDLGGVRHQPHPQRAKAGMKLLTTLVGILVGLVALASPAGADALQDQRFLDIVHANGVAGQDESLVAYAQEWCNTNGPYPTVFPL